MYIFPIHYTCNKQDIVDIKYMCTKFENHTFITENTSPVEITLTLPGGATAGPMPTSWVGCTLVTQRTLPTKRTPETHTQNIIFNVSPDQEWPKCQHIKILICFSFLYVDNMCFFYSQSCGCFDVCLLNIVYGISLLFYGLFIFFHKPVKHSCRIHTFSNCMITF